MTDSPQQQEENKNHNRKRQCDYCNNRTALIYCRADSAKLCLSCDVEVHSTNQLFSKHTRLLLCDACDTSPASIFCETEHSVFCHNCDWEHHRGQSHDLSSPSSLHNRRPIEGFSGCPSVFELAASFGFDDLGRDQKDLFLSGERDGGDSGEGFFGSREDEVSGFGDEYSDLFVWDTPAVVSIADLIVSGDSGRSFRALGVPPLPKNRNAACGKHKEEILQQLRKLAKSEPGSHYDNADVDSVEVFQPLPADRNQGLFTSCEPDLAAPSLGYEENFLQLLTDDGDMANQSFLPSTNPEASFFESSEVPDLKSNMSAALNNVTDNHEAQAQHGLASRTVPTIPKVPPYELNSQERDSAISRYKEKRKTRRYEKHIRYESRKVRAETRTRIKGRFAKADQ